MGCLYFVDGKKRHLGYFAVEAEAAEAYNEAGSSTGGGGCRFGCRESAECAEYIYIYDEAPKEAEWWRRQEDEEGGCEGGDRVMDRCAASLTFCAAWLLSHLLPKFYILRAT